MPRRTTVRSFSVPEIIEMIIRDEAAVVASLRRGLEIGDIATQYGTRWLVAYRAICRIPDALAIFHASQMATAIYYKEKRDRKLVGASAAQPASASPVVAEEPVLKLVDEEPIAVSPPTSVEVAAPVVHGISTAQEQSDNKQAWVQRAHRFAELHPDMVPLVATLVCNAYTSDEIGQILGMTEHNVACARFVAVQKGWIPLANQDKAQRALTKARKQRDRDGNFRLPTLQETIDASLTFNFSSTTAEKSDAAVVTPITASVNPVVSEDVQRLLAQLKALASAPKVAESVNEIQKPVETAHDVPAIVEVVSTVVEPEPDAVILTSKPITRPKGFFGRALATLFGDSPNRSYGKL